MKKKVTRSKINYRGGVYIDGCGPLAIIIVTSLDHFFIACFNMQEGVNIL